MIRAFLNYCPATVSKHLISSYFKMGSFLVVGTKKFHSSPETVQFSNMKVKIIPALKDNYMYLIVDENTNEAAVVDPVEPAKVMKAVDEENVLLTTALVTHHHWDHAGGNKELLKLYPGIEFVGGDDRIDCLNTKVSHNEKLKLGDLVIECLSTPCHTKGHVCYYIPQQKEPSAVFTGDTLFSAGCGRFFEGTASEMYKGLIEILGNLPDTTNVFCGHEYTVNNLKFAREIEPTNTFVKDRLKWAIEQRESNKPTVPSTIGDEKKMNPFMRVCHSHLQKTLKISDPIIAMHALRQKKDEF